MNMFWNAVGRVSCFLGFHHMHDLKDKEVAIRSHSDLAVDGEYCCRCHKINIKEIKFKGEVVKAKVKKVDL